MINVEMLSCDIVRYLS